MKSRILVVPAAIALTQMTNAQVVGPAIRAHSANTSARSCSETAIIAAGSAVAVAYNDYAGQMHYSISTKALTGANPFAVFDANLTGVDCNSTEVLTRGVDPMVARSTNGDLYLGGMFRYPIGGLSSSNAIAFSRKPAGSSSLDPAINLVCWSLEMGSDKPLMAIGPRPGGATGERLYAAHTRVNQGNCGNYNSRSSSKLLLGSSIDDVPIGLDLNCGVTTLGCMPIVLPSGPSKGRLIVTMLPGPTLGNLPQVWRSDNEGLPTGGGQSWLLSSTPTQTRTPGVAGFEDLLAFDGQGASAVVPGNFRVHNFSALANDPGNSNSVYLVFVAGTPSAGASNLDIIISKSEDAGATFLSTNTLHITDSLLGLVTGTDQIMPWIAVDVSGGINLLFYSVNENATTDMENVPYFRVYYARFPSFSATSPPTPFVHALSPTFLVPVVPGASWPDGAQVTGDYQMICADSCNAYVAYMSAETGAADIYVRKITGLCAIADSDQVGAITTNDPPTFAMQFLACDPLADLTNNGTIDAADMQHFLTAFACQCNP
ncbi:MAG: hypothetical protein ACKVW3_02220 [Phycisphaerales bacterium]